MNTPENLCFFRSMAGISGHFSPDLNTLSSLHNTWPQTIPFENIDVLLDRSVSIRTADIADKLFNKGRGGYCFEHNILFRSILEEAGFDITSHLARVVWGADMSPAPPQTHMLLLIRVEKKHYIADVGFGGVSLTTPLRLEEGPQKGFMLERHGSNEWLLSFGTPDCKRPMYIFSERPCEEADILVASHFVATHENSLFRHNLMMAGMINGEQHNLLNQRLVVHGHVKKEQQAHTPEEFSRFIRLFFRKPDALSCDDIQALYSKLNR